MKNTFTYILDDGKILDIPEEENEDFKSVAGDKAHLAHNFRVNDRDVTIDDANVNEFLQDYPDAKPMTRMRLADGETRDFTEDELSPRVTASHANEWKADTSEDVQLENRLKLTGGTLIDTDHRNRPMRINRDANGKIDSYSTTASTIVRAKDQNNEDAFFVVPTIWEDENGKMVSAKNYQEAEEHFNKTGQTWGGSQDLNEAKQLAQDVHDYHQKIYQKDWNEYLHQNWDDVSDNIVLDPEMRKAHNEWIEKNARIPASKFITQGNFKDEELYRDGDTPVRYNAKEDKFIPALLPDSIEYKGETLQGFTPSDKKGQELYQKVKKFKGQNIDLLNQPVYAELDEKTGNVKGLVNDKPEVMEDPISGKFFVVPGVWKEKNGEESVSVKARPTPELSNNLVASKKEQQEEFDELARRFAPKEGETKEEKAKREEEWGKEWQKVNSKWTYEDNLKVADEMDMSGTAQEHYQMKHKKYGEFDTREEAENAAKDIEELYKNVYQTKNTLWLFEHWDDLDDSLKTSELSAMHDKWVADGSKGIVLPQLSDEEIRVRQEKAIRLAKRNGEIKKADEWPESTPMGPLEYQKESWEAQTGRKYSKVKATMLNVLPYAGDFEKAQAYKADKIIGDFASGNFDWQNPSEDALQEIGLTPETYKSIVTDAKLTTQNSRSAEEKVKKAIKLAAEIRGEDILEVRSAAEKELTRPMGVWSTIGAKTIENTNYVTGFMGPSIGVNIAAKAITRKMASNAMAKMLTLYGTKRGMNGVAGELTRFNALLNSSSAMFVPAESFAIEQGLRTLEIIAGGIPNTISGGVRRSAELNAPEFTYNGDNDFEIVYNGYDALRSGIQGGVGSAVENIVVEGLTDVIVDVGLRGMARIPVAGAIIDAWRKTKGKITGKMMNSSLGRAALRVGNAYDTLAQTTNFNSYPVEHGEELIQPWWDECLGLGLKKDKECKSFAQYLKDNFTVKNQCDIFLGLAGTMLIQGGGAVARAAAWRYSDEGKQYEEGVRSARSILEDLGVDKKVLGILTDKQLFQTMKAYSMLCRNPKLAETFANTMDEAAKKCYSTLLAGETWKAATGELKDFGIDVPKFKIRTQKGADGKSVPVFTKMEMVDPIDGTKSMKDAMVDPATGIAIIDNGKKAHGTNEAFTIYDTNTKEMYVHVKDRNGHTSVMKTTGAYKAGSIVDAMTMANLHLAYKTTEEKLPDARDNVKTQIINNMIAKNFAGMKDKIHQFRTMDEALAWYTEQTGKDLTKDPNFKANRMGFHMPDGSIVLVRDNFTTPQSMMSSIPSEIIRVLRHESIGHSSTMNDAIFFDANEHSQMSRLQNENLEAKKAKYENGEEDPFAPGAPREEDVIDTILRESGANTIQNRSHNPTFTEKIIAGVRRVARKANPNLRVSDAEIEVVASKVEKAAREGTPEAKAEAEKALQKLDPKGGYAKAREGKIGVGDKVRIATLDGIVEGRIIRQDKDTGDIQYETEKSRKNKLTNKIETYTETHRGNIKNVVKVVESADTTSETRSEETTPPPSPETPSPDTSTETPKPEAPKPEGKSESETPDTTEAEEEDAVFTDTAGNTHKMRGYVKPKDGAYGIGARVIAHVNDGNVTGKITSMEGGIITLSDMDGNEISVPKDDLIGIDKNNRGEVKAEEKAEEKTETPKTESKEVPREESMTDEELMNRIDELEDKMYDYTVDENGKTKRVDKFHTPEDENELNALKAEQRRRLTKAKEEESGEVKTTPETSTEETPKEAPKAETPAPEATPTPVTAETPKQEETSESPKAENTKQETQETKPTEETTNETGNVGNEEQTQPEQATASGPEAGQAQQVGTQEQGSVKEETPSTPSTSEASEAENAAKAKLVKAQNKLTEARQKILDKGKSIREYYSNKIQSIRDGKTTVDEAIDQIVGKSKNLPDAAHAALKNELQGLVDAEDTEKALDDYIILNMKRSSSPENQKLAKELTTLERAVKQAEKDVKRSARAVKIEAKQKVKPETPKAQIEVPKTKEEAEAKRNEIKKQLVARPETNTMREYIKNKIATYNEKKMGGPSVDDVVNELAGSKKLSKAERDRMKRRMVRLAYFARHNQTEEFENELDEAIMDDIRRKGKPEDKATLAQLRAHDKVIEANTPKRAKRGNYLAEKSIDAFALTDESLGILAYAARRGADGNVLGLFKIPMDELHRSQRGKKYSGVGTSDTMSDDVVHLLDGHGGIRYSKSGKLNLGKSAHVPKELRYIFGNSLQIGSNDTLIDDLRGWAKDGLLKDDMSAEAIIALLDKDKKNYERWCNRKDAERFAEDMGLPVEYDVEDMTDEQRHYWEQEQAALADELHIGDEVYSLDELEAKSRADEAYNNAWGEVDKYDGGNEVILSFSRDRLQELKPDDLLQFDHTGETFEFVSYDAENDVLTLEDWLTREREWEKTGKFDRIMIQYKVSQDGIAEIRKDKEENGQENEAVTTDDGTSNAQGERGENSAEVAEGTQSGATSGEAVTEEVSEAEEGDDAPKPSTISAEMREKAKVAQKALKADALLSDKELEAKAKAWRRYPDALRQARAQAAEDLLAYRRATAAQEAKLVDDTPQAAVAQMRQAKKAQAKQGKPTQAKQGLTLESKTQGNNHVIFDYGRGEAKPFEGYVEPTDADLTVGREVLVRIPPGDGGYARPVQGKITEIIEKHPRNGLTYYDIEGSGLTRREDIVGVKPTLTLESSSQEELDAERAKAKQDAAMKERAERPIKGSAGEIGQQQFDLGDTNGDLFNPVVPNEGKEKRGGSGSVSFDSPEMQKRDEQIRREYDAVVAAHTNADGTKKPTWMKAPNGKKTKLTERQWVQVRTRAFKAWFGDWENDPANASKVVDANGEPMVVYHFTHNEFTEFDIRKLGENTFSNASDIALASTASVGMWFTNDKEVWRFGVRRMEVFLNIRDAKEYGSLGGLAEDLLENYIDEDAFNAYDNGEHEDEELRRVGRRYRNALRYYRYDGISIEKDEEIHATSYITFSPNQIKSATDNVGSFSAANDDIRWDSPELARPKDENDYEGMQRFKTALRRTLNQIDWDTPEMGRKAKDEVRATLRRSRPDLNKREIEDAVNEIAKFENTKERRAAAWWLSKGAIRLPEDMLKVKQAIEIGEASRARVEGMKKVIAGHEATIKAAEENLAAQTDEQKIERAQMRLENAEERYQEASDLVPQSEGVGYEPFNYDSPMEMMDALHKFKPRGKPINPDTVPYLSDKRDMGHGVVTYLVDESRESQQAMREIINTHWGEDANPWCLLQGDGKGNLQEETDSVWGARHYWNRYNNLPKRVAFKNGKLLAFMATDLSPKFGEVWWDRQDHRHQDTTYGKSRIPYANAKIPGDPYGRWADYELINGELVQTGNYYKGKRGRDGYREWYGNGYLKDAQEDGIEIGWNIIGEMDYYCDTKSNFLADFMHDEDGTRYVCMVRHTYQSNGFPHEVYNTFNSKGEILKDKIQDKVDNSEFDKERGKKLRAEMKAFRDKATSLMPSYRQVSPGRFAGEIGTQFKKKESENGVDFDSPELYRKENVTPERLEYVKARMRDLLAFVGKMDRGENLEGEKGRFFTLAKTSDFLKSYGLKGDTFTIRAGDILRHRNKDSDHHLSEQEWIDIADSLENEKPILIEKYKGKDDSFRVWVPAHINGNPAIVGADINTMRDNIDGKIKTINTVKTIFGAGKARPKLENVIYENTKETLGLTRHNSGRDPMSPTAHIISQDGRGSQGGISREGKVVFDSPEMARQVDFSTFIGELGAKNNEDIANDLKVAMDALGDRDWNKLTKDEKRKIVFATGWEKGADGKWRHEWKDLDREAITKTLYKHVLDLYKQYEESSDYYIPEKLGKFLSPELKEAYPEFANIPLNFLRGDKHGYGGATSGYMITIVPEVIHSGVNTFMDVLTHEVQHLVQQAEGFALGSNPQWEAQLIKQNLGGEGNEVDKAKGDVDDKMSSLRHTIASFFLPYAEKCLKEWFAVEQKPNGEYVYTKENETGKMTVCGKTVDYPKPVFAYYAIMEKLVDEVQDDEWREMFFGARREDGSYRLHAYAIHKLAQRIDLGDLESYIGTDMIDYDTVLPEDKEYQKVEKIAEEFSAAIGPALGEAVDAQEKYEETYKVYELDPFMEGRDRYRRSAGEVEARNAASREYDATNKHDLIEDTEDVPRSEQIVRFDSPEMAKRDKEHKDVAARLNEERKKVEKIGGEIVLAKHGTNSRGFTKFEKTDDIGYFFAKSGVTAGSYVRGNNKTDLNRPGLIGYTEAIDWLRSHKYEREVDGEVVVENILRHGWVVKKADGEVLSRTDERLIKAYEAKEDAERVRDQWAQIYDGVTIAEGDVYKGEEFYEGKIPYGRAVKLYQVERPGVGFGGIYNVALRMEKPYIVDCKGRNWNEIQDDSHIPEDAKVYSVARIWVDFDEDGKIRKYQLRYSEEVGGITYSARPHEYDTEEEFLNGVRDILGTAMSENARTILPNFAPGVLNEDNLISSEWAIEPYVYSKKLDAGFVQKDEMTTRQVVAKAKALGYDGVIFKNVIDNGGGLTKESVGVDDVYVVMNSNQIKSVDDVTYDDDGNIIPVDRRFDWSNDDIRWDSPELAQGKYILSGDEVRKAMPGYDAQNWRTHVDRDNTFVAPRMEAQFQHLLNTRLGKGNGTVLFLAGGNGSGKSTVANGEAKEHGDNYDFTIDSTLGNLATVRRQIKTLLDRGEKVDIDYVYCDPNVALNRVIERAENGGHIVSPASFANSHTQPRKNLRLLSDEFNGIIRIKIFDNSVAGAPEISLEELEAKEKISNEQLKERARQVIGDFERRRDSSRTVDKDYANRFTGSGAASGETQSEKESSIDFDSPELAEKANSFARAEYEAARAREKLAHPDVQTVMDMSQGKWETVRVLFQDAKLPILALEKELEKRTGHTLNKKDSTYYAKDFEFGKNEYELTILQKKRIDPIFKKMMEYGLTQEAVDMYLTARHAPYRNAVLRGRGATDGSGMSDADAARILNEFTRMGYADRLAEIADMVYTMNNEALERRVKSGRIDAETAANLRATLMDYVPLRNNNENKDMDSFNTYSSGWHHNEFRQAKGRSTLADSPLAWSIVQAERAIKDANLNETMQVAARFARACEAAGMPIGKIIPGRKVSGRWVFSLANTKFVAGPNGIGRFGGDTGFFYEDIKDSPDLIFFKENGQLMAIQVDEGKEGYGIKFAKAVTDKDFKHMPDWLAWMGNVTRFMSAVRTQYVPTFIFRNLKADFAEVLLNRAGEIGAGLDMAKFMKDLVASEAQNLKDVRRWFKYGEADGYVKEYVENGGLIGGGMVAEGFTEAQKRLADSIKAYQMGKAKQAGKVLLDGIGLMNACAEYTTRIGVYSALRKEGWSIEDAISYARDATTNFNRKGTLTPIINSFYMFSNAAIQGMSRSFKSMRSKHGVQTLVGLMLLGALEAWLNNMFGGGDDDDDGKSSVKNITEYEKQNTIGIPIGGDKRLKTTIRMPWAGSKYLGYKMMELMLNWDKDGEATKISKDLLSALGNFATDPVGGNGLGSMSEFLQSISFTATDPLVQWATGKDYKGENRLKRNFNDNAPDSWNGRENTPEIYKWIAQSLNAISGGDQYEKGAFDTSPENWKLAAETVLGGIMTDLNRLISTGENAYKWIREGEKPEKTLREIPFVRDTISQAPDISNKYYEMMGMQESAAYKLKKMENDDAVSAEAYDAFEAKHPWGSDEELKDLKQEIKELTEDERSAETTKESREIHDEKLQAMANFVKRMNELRREVKRGSEEE